MIRPTLANFKELGSGANPGIPVTDLRRQMYNELESLESTEAGRVTAGHRIVVQLYFPDRIGEDNIYTAEIKVKEKRDRQTDMLDASIDLKNYMRKHDTRKTPIFFSTEEYEAAEREGRLNYSIMLPRILSREPKPMYFVHIK